MSKIVSILKSGWFIGLIGTLFLILLVWFLGPLIGFGDSRPLEGIAARLLVALVFLVIWAGFVVWGLLRRRKRQTELVDGVTRNAAAGGAAGPEVEALRKGLERALGELQRMRRKDGKSGRQYLYELPWYMIIGPPGSGKTTALLNSGLGFPLGNDPQQAKVSGAGGTRNCDWWFTDEAVLLDTAGRYTTQDSDATMDAAAWEGFLDILRKARPRQPVNGLIVAISISDIMTASEPERRAHALAIRKRIAELYDRLGLRPPVYVMLTKADLVAGFMEFFGDMRRDDRAQVWGMTYPFLDLKKGDDTDPLDLFPEEFDLLLERLEQGRLDRLHQEDDFARAGLITGFPLQVAALRDPVMQVLEEAFRAGRYEEPILLRGVYFTSGTQEGTPIDRVMAGLAGRFGVPPARFGAYRGQGRSFFLTRLLREVLFKEAGMVGRNRAVERRQRLVRGGAIALASVLLLTGIGLWTWSTLVNRDLIARTEAGIATYRTQVADIVPGDGETVLVDSADVRPVLPPLATLRDLPLGYAERDAPTPTGAGFGLYQGDKLGQQAQSAYTEALNGLLLPRLTFRLRESLTETRETERLYGLLKLYLMVGGQGPVSATPLRNWVDFDLGERYPGPRNEPLRQEVAAHVVALTDGVLRTMPIDGPLVERVRDILRQQPLAERAYALIKNSQAAKALPKWRVIDAAGPAARRVFVRRSGADLDDGVDGFYTYTGFHEVFLPSLVQVAQRVASESWVLGESATLDDAQIRLLERDLAALYMDDYVAQWDGLLADVELRPFDTANDATDVLALLSGANSPLRNVLNEVAQQTRLARPEEDGGIGAAIAGLGSGGDVGARAEAVEGAASEARNVGQTLGLGTGGISVVERLAGIFSDSSFVGGSGSRRSSGGAASERALPGQYVNDRFQQLHAYVLAQDGSTPPLEDLIRQLGQAYNELRRVADSGGGLSAVIGGGGGGGSVDAVRRLGTQATQVPAPLSGWLEHIASGGQSIAVSSTQQGLETVWSADVLPLCRQALNNRYPFASGSGSDVAMADFVRLFAPNGLIDSFFRQNLMPYVDMGRRPWTSRRHNGIDLGLSRATLAQFERAAVIRDAFFPTGGSQLNVPFEVTPVSLDADANSVVMEIDGQQVSYAHGPVLPARLSWPGPGTQTRVSFQSTGPGLPSISGFSGPWAFFRLLDQGRRLDGGTGDRFRIQFSTGGLSAIFEIRAGSVTNPFNLRELKAFRCPGNL
ncbi:type VI secretion system membrane subunit TssM [Roseospira marina]|uniref:Type VI secretion system membrane subunit TssM n=1 Tax=Roseospira marina TaxID=140057 RepID=A0A5M6IGW4_9PROT|nr:type VI secretion system membrane subunit TssM [Roseospira marina]KAA5606915.1 type VI secretion system membrane subunit TssM [Roseospira marina]MBB4312914.1 type VI secretion system protein ImpL [Roseospira marina]MBB5086313.1 type VI secretion system protein ImpL [Roseospira marina]